MLNSARNDPPGPEAHLGQASGPADEAPRGLRDLRLNHYLVPDRPIPLVEPAPTSPEPGGDA
jgi:hypothetical protein